VSGNEPGGIEVGDVTGAGGLAGWQPSTASHETSAKAAAPRRVGVQAPNPFACPQCRASGRPVERRGLSLMSRFRKRALSIP
jgi:hypothetical protein